MRVDPIWTRSVPDRTESENNPPKVRVVLGVLGYPIGSAI